MAAYTAYRSWTTGELVTAALMNEQVRDNGLLTAPAIMTTAGDIMYASAANTPVRLAKSTTSTQYLANTGTSNVPQWNEVALATGVSGTLPVGNGGTGITSLGSNVATFMGTPSSANLRGALTDETGTGVAVFATSPAFTTGITLTDRFIASAGAFAFQEATTISTTAGNLTLNPTGDIVFQQGANEVGRFEAAYGGYTDTFRVKGVTAAFSTEIHVDALSGYDSNVVFLQAATWKYSLGYDASANYMRLTSTDVDGAGTNGDIFRILDGQRSINFYGDLDFQQAATISTSTGVLAFDGAAGSEIRMNEAGIDVNFVVEAENNVGFQVDAGSFGGVGSIGIGGGIASTTSAINLRPLARTAVVDTSFFAVDVVNSTVTIPASTVDIGQVFTMRIDEPLIVNNSGNLITVAATLYLRRAPTEAVSNYTLFVDAGAVRFDGSLWVESTPTEGTSGEQLTSGGAGAVMTWAAASSQRSAKNILDHRITPAAALQRMVSAEVLPFKYKDNMGTGDYETEYLGIMAEDAPWAMHYQGGILNPVNTFGHTVLAIQALEARIKELEGAR